MLQKRRAANGFEYMLYENIIYTNGNPDAIFFVALLTFKNF